MAYPVNVWLVDNHLKHGMGTVRVLGEGGERASEPSTRAAPNGHGGTDMSKTIVTSAQINVMAVLTIVLLAAAVVLAAALGDFTSQPAHPPEVDRQTPVTSEEQVAWICDLSDLLLP